MTDLPDFDEELIVSPADLIQAAQALMKGDAQNALDQLRRLLGPEYWLYIELDQWANPRDE